LDAGFAEVPEQAELVLAEAGADALAERLATTQEVLTSGRGLAFGTTLEVALKLEETCLRPVRGLSYADLKHGPIAIVDHDLVTVLVAAPSGPTLPGLLELASTAQLVVERLARRLGLDPDAPRGLRKVTQTD
jgi:glucosamine--fructose-6-phosphate aminotransferase (isomerizing)